MTFMRHNTPDPENLTGTQAADTLVGGGGNDTLDGLDGNDLLSGGADDDLLLGGRGDDTLDGGSGNDVLNGGPGVDTAIMNGARADFSSITDELGAQVLTNTVTGTVYTMSGMERFQFTDGLTDTGFNLLAGGAGLITGLGGEAGFGENVLPANDDLSSDQIDLSPIFEDGINFFGTLYQGLWVNNNGSVTFGGPRSTFTPDVITGVSNNPEITPFFGDVDTRGLGETLTPGGNSTGSNLVYWDFNEVTDQFIVTWDDVGYFASATDLSNAFQLILTDRGNGDFDIQFRYEEINWTTGDASDGENGLGGEVARAGYTAGTGEAGTFFELPQSGNQAAMLSLDAIPGNNGLIGLWNFNVRNGGVIDSIVPLLPEGASPGWVAGDPHLSTLDGVGYDFQAAGEFVLLRDPDSGFEIQARMVPVGDNVSVNAAVATRLGETAVMIDGTDDIPLTVGGVATVIEDFGVLEVGDDRIFREGNTYTIVYAGADGVVGDGDSQLIVQVRGDRVDLDVRLNAALTGNLVGLLGDGDGNPDNDIALADGTVLARPLAFADVYGQYRDDWRVRSETQSLFTYDDGESLAGFYDEDFPGETVTLADLDPDLRAAAETAAANAGLTPGTPNFDNAVLDFALTGDASFITSAAEVPQTIEVVIPTAAPVPLDLTGTDGNDTLNGGVLDDTIDGGAGNDRIVGRAGNDSLEGGPGNDAMLGDSGDDTMSGGDGDDTLAASDGNDSVDGGAGNDLIGGGFGDDVLDGGTGDDFMGGGQGNDTMNGGDDNDVVNGGQGSDSLEGGAGNDTMGASFGNDTVAGGDGNDDMGGGAGRDLISGGAGDDSAGGGEGDDTIDGGAGNDFLAGGGRNDSIDGGTGNDVINGGAGNDTMSGGEGADVFVFNEFVSGESDLILGFEDGVDLFRMAGVVNAPGTGLQGRVDALNITDAVIDGAAGVTLTYQGHTVSVTGVSAADLGVSDFDFV